MKIVKKALCALTMIIVALAIARQAELRDRFKNKLNTPVGPWHLKKGDYKIDIFTRKGSPAIDKGLFWGFESYRVVDEIKISYKGQNMLVPRLVFADLASVTKAELKGSSSRVYLVITGGDGSETYQCTVVISSGELVERTVRIGLGTRDGIEKTTFAN